MPYSIRKGKGKRPYKVVKRTTGQVVGTSTSLEKAQASIRARYAGEHGK